MKYGLMYAYFHKDWEGDYIPEIKRISRLGFDHMEMHTDKLLRMSDDEIKEIRDTARENSLDLVCCICLGAATDISSENIQVRKAGIRYATELLRKVQLIGGKKVAGINYVGWNCFDGIINKPRRIENSVASMKEIIKTAEDLGIDYGFEVTNRFEQFMLNTAAEAVEFCRMVDSPRALVQLDINHMMIEEVDIYGAICTAGKLLSHLHVAESDRSVPKGGGFIPWGELARGLRDIGYNDTISLEPLTKLGGTVAQSASMWRQFVPDVSDAGLEKDILEGLAFIKSVFG